MRARFAVLLLVTAAQSAIAAEILHCPTLSNARPVGSCPSPQELKYTYIGYCSDNARMYAKDNEECADFELYRRLKNTVLWETVDGLFHGYVSCDLPVASVKTLTPENIAVVKQGNITRLICTYPQGGQFRVSVAQAMYDRYGREMRCRDIRLQGTLRLTRALSDMSGHDR